MRKLSILLIFALLMSLALTLCSCTSDEVVEEEKIDYSKYPTKNLNVYNWGEYISDEDDEEYEDYSDLNEDDEYSLDDEAYYEIECPSCSEKICFTDDIDIETLVCPACGEVVGDVEIVTEEE